MAHEVYGGVTTTTKATISTTSPSLELGWLAFINNNRSRVAYVIIAY
jgi:hypothetical protein